MIRTVSATRYVTPLRQGGSLPALVEAEPDPRRRGALAGGLPGHASVYHGDPQALFSHRVAHY